MIYHVFNRSIADFKIFNTPADYNRFVLSMDFFRHRFDEKVGLSNLIYLEKEIKLKKEDRFLKIIAYCIMPNHYHIIIDDNDNGLMPKYIGNLENSYTRYFNIHHKRKGPLWESRYRKVVVKNDPYFIHLTRYIHLNPVTAYICDKPETWEYSSYKEYIRWEENMCEYKYILPENFSRHNYISFVEDRISYQRELSLIKHMLLE